MQQMTNRVCSEKHCEIYLKAGKKDQETRIKKKVLFS